MKIDFNKNSIVLSENEYKLDELLAKLASLSGNQVHQFLSNRNIQIPRLLNLVALRAVLNKKIVLLKTTDLTKEEFEKLKYYSYFSEEQIFRLLKKLELSEEEFYDYRLNIFKIILKNNSLFELTDNELIYLKNLKETKIESFNKYFNYISGSTAECNNAFDGVDLNILNEYLPLSATNSDLDDIISKYGLDIKDELSKEEFLDYIKYYLNNNNTSKAIIEELEEMSIDELNTFTSRMNISMHSKLSVSEKAKYLLYFVSLCEIPTTKCNDILLDDIYNPINFEIDFDKINNNTGENCIIYNNDLDILNKIEESNEMAKKEKLEEKNIVDDELTLATDNSDDVEENKDDILVDSAEIEDVEEVIEENKEEQFNEYYHSIPDKKEENDVDEETEELISSILENGNVEEKEEVEEEIKIDDNLNYVVKNDDFGNKKLLKYRTKSKIWILYFIIVLILLAVACYIAIVLLK